MQRSQDIYGRGAAPEPAAPPPPSPGNRPSLDPFTEAVRRNRRITALFLLASTAVLALLGYLVSRDLLDRRAAPAEGRRSAVDAPASYPDHPAGLGADERMLLDSLEEQSGAETESAPADAPLDARWVKRAALSLVQAEAAVRRGRIDEGMGHYREALRVYPDLAGVHRPLGLLHLRRKAYDEAVAALQVAVAEEPDAASPANNLGVAYLARRDYGDAEAMFLRALGLDPDYALANLNLATLYVRWGRPAEALPFYARYRALEPDDLDTAQAYGLLLVEQQQWEAGIAELLTVKAQHPDVAPIYFRLAEAYAQTGDLDAAAEELEEGVRRVDARAAMGWMSKGKYDALRDHPDFINLVRQLEQALP